MKIRHERPMSDLEFKVRAPLRLELQGGEVVDVCEWSQSGITFPKETDVLPKRGFLTIPFQGVDIRFEVAFSNGQRPQDLNFKDLTGRQREVIGVFYRSILSGKMAASEDVITSLDTPVDLVPMGETEDEEAAGKAKQKPRILRVIWNLVFYALLSVVLVGLIGGQIWDRLTSVNFSNGRVVAPMIAQHASADAYIEEVLVEPGTAVTRGQTLVRLTNPDRESLVDDIRRNIARAKKQVSSERALLETHLIAQRTTRAKLSARYEDQLAKWHYSDFLAGRATGQVIQDWRALRDFDQGRSNERGDFHDMRRQLKMQLDESKETERRLKRDLSNAKAQARAIDIVAQADGVISEILVFEDEYIARGQHVLSIEENAPRHVVAWVDEARADAIYTGMDVEIRFRDGTGPKTYNGTISDITAGVDPITENGFGMIVTLTLPQMSLAESRDVLREGAPVKARALKEWRLAGWGK